MSIHWWPFRTTRKKTIRRPFTTRPQFDTLEDRAVPTNNTFATASAIAPLDARLESTPVDQWTTIRDKVTAAAPDFYKLSVNSAFGLAVDMKTDPTGSGVITEIYDSNQNLIYSTLRFNAIGRPTYLSLPFSFGDEESEPGAAGLYYDLGPGTYYIKNSVRFGSNDFTMRVLTDTVYSAAVPEFNSNPGAPVSVYLDFDGYSTKSPTDYWVQRNAPNGYSFPALNLRGDGHIGNAATFSPGERLYMANTWKRVAEDYAPFNINVTTKDVPLFVNNQPAGVRAIITNKDADLNWHPGAAGYAPLDGMSLFPGEGPAINFAPTDLLDTLQNQGGFAGVNASVLGGAGSLVTHEVAHAFGLNHQFGAKTSTPNLGPGPAVPVPLGLPGNISQGSTFTVEDSIGTWLIGMNTPDPRTNSPSILQNDMDVIAKPANRAGYRSDDAGNSRAAAVALTAANNSFKKNGVIEQSADVDFYSFAAAGKTSITVDVPGRSADPNLITMIELQDSNGNVVSQGVKVAGDRSYTNLHATLTVRTGNDAGTLQFGAAPGLVVGDVFNVSWGENFEIKARRSMRVTAVNGNAVTVADGFGEDLPAQGSVVLISKPLPTGRSTIAVDNLAAGTYYLKVSSTGRRSTDNPNNFIENVGQYAIDVRTDVPAVNAPPVVTLPGGAFSQKAKEAATRLDANATVTDADSPDFNGGRLTVSITANGTTDDTLAIISDAVVSVNLIVGDISYNGDVIGTVTGGTAGTPLVVAFNSDKATPAAAQEILRRVTFANAAAAANIGQPRTISVVARDRQGSDSVAVTKVVTVTIPAQQVIRVAFNRGLTVPINAPELFTSNDLQVVAPATALGPPPVEYTLTQAPKNGVLVLAATAGVPLLPDLPPIQLRVGDKFEQGDIDSGRLAYRLTPGSAANSDQFSFTATDLISGTTPDTVFNIRVNRGAAPVAGNPAQPFGIQIGVASIGIAEATVDLFVTIDAAPTVTTIGSNRLSFLGDPRDLRYDIISGPTYGSLNLPTTFTQQNINDNGLTYTAPKVADVPFGVTQDTFTYVVTDISTGGVSDPITFTIEFNNPNDAPEFIAGKSTVELNTILPIGPHSNAARIQDIVEGIVNDPDDVTGQTNSRGIAITGFDDSNGLWEYTLDGGISWDLIPSNVSNTNALLLSGNDTLQAVRFTADADFNGSAQFIFRLWDQSEGANGDLFDLTSTETDAFSLATGTVVQPVMAEARAPSFHPGPEVVVNEDAGLVVVPNWATNIEGDNLDSEIVFVVSADDGGSDGITFLTQPTISANGTLTFEVAPNSSGTVVFDVIITSAFGDSDTAKLTITVNPVNDAPTISVGGNIRVAATAGAVTLIGWATGISTGPSDEAAQSLSVGVSTDHPEFFDVQPTLNLATGSLSFTPNVLAVGTANVFISLLDSGGADNGGVAGTTRSMTIAIDAGSPLATRPIAWIKNIYLDLLGRDADPQGIITWAGALAAGVSRDDIVREILKSAEYNGIQIANLYRTLIRREPDAVGLNSLVAAVQGGVSLRTVKEAILSSQEYFITQGGGTGAGFVAAIFRDVLGRPVDAATLANYGTAIDRFLEAPVSALTLGGSTPRLSPLAFAQIVVRSAEANAVFVRGAFGRLLGRAPEGAALNAYVGSLLGGATESDVLLKIVLSQEYYVQA